MELLELLGVEKKNNVFVCTCTTCMDQYGKRQP